MIIYLLFAFCLARECRCLATSPNNSERSRLADVPASDHLVITSVKEFGSKTASEVAVLTNHNDTLSYELISAGTKHGAQRQRFVAEFVSSSTASAPFTFIQSKVVDLKSVLRSTFLPRMMIPQGYIKYITWNAIQDLSTQLRSVVATQRVLEGIGVGRADATAISASINFIIRDGAGMAASLLFTSLSASNFRYDVKRWRLFADLIVDVGITLEVAATLVSRTLFLPMICKLITAIVPLMIALILSFHGNFFF